MTGTGSTINKAQEGRKPGNRGHVHDAGRKKSGRRTEEIRTRNRIKKGTGTFYVQPGYRNTSFTERKDEDNQLEIQVPVLVR
jgi:hypothetical protein